MNDAIYKWNSRTGNFIRVLAISNIIIIKEIELIIAIVKAVIKKSRHGELREIANTLQFEYAPNEEGCEQYESFIDGNTFLTIERWRDQASLDIHLKASHVEKYVPKLRDCVVDGCFDVQFIKASDVSFTRV